MTWTEERVTELTRLWQAGTSATEAGHALGVSRNAVIGKVYRMRKNGIALRGGDSTQPGPKKPPKQVVKPVAVKPAPEPVEPPAEPRMLTCLELTSHTCKWPYGDPKQPGFGFCGHAVEPGSPYCAAHAAASVGRAA